MEEKPKSRRDRYDVSGNVEAQFVDEEQLVLANKRGIIELEKLQIAEEEALARAYEKLLSEVRTDTLLTCALMQHVHRRIFGELYDWAGRWRTVWISKPGVTWPPPDFLAEQMSQFENDVLRKYPASSLEDDEAFIHAVAEIQGEFLVIHPLREGNARTIKLVTDLLASQGDRPLLAYDQSKAGADRYIEGAKAAFKEDYGPLACVIRQALAEAK